MTPNSPEEGHSPSPAEQKELDEFLRENLANGHNHLSKSPIRAPVFFIKKKEGSLCLVQDYWKLNEIMIKNSYPFPLVSDMLTRLCNAEWFTTLDLHWGFNNIHLKEGDDLKAAFSTNWGLFEPLIMFFGLCNSPATFQTMMNDILCPFINRNEAICYMDDILIYSSSLMDHQRITQEILQTSVPTSYSSNWRNASSNVERWTTLGLLSLRTMWRWTLLKSKESRTGRNQRRSRMSSPS